MSDLCKERFGASASSKQCIGRSGAWPKAKTACCGKLISTEEDDGQVQICPISDLRQATTSRDRGDQALCQAHLLRGDPQQEWCWPPLQWPGVHTPPMVPQSKLPSDAGDNMSYKGGRAGIYLFNSTIGSFLLLLLCLGKSGKQGLPIWASTRAAVLYRHLTPKIRHEDRAQALYFWAPLICFEYFPYKTKEKGSSPRVKLYLRYLKVRYRLDTES